MPVRFSSRASWRSHASHGRLRSTQASRLLLLAALTGAAVIPCLAAEGFFADNMPPAVRAIWPSVYAYVCESRTGTYTATAFLVNKTSRGKLADYTFITAGHAIEECKSPRRYLAENINQQPFESDGITLAKPPQRLDGVKLVYLDDAYDIAVVRAEAATGLQMGNPLRVDGNCDRSLHREIYAVGFPGVTKRRTLRMNREVKRWSKGDYVGLGRADFRGTTSTYIASTVDSLPGSSGGPVVDENGVLVGVAVKGVASEENNFRYDVDSQKRDDWQTFLVPCGAVLRIMDRSGIKTPAH
jgi:S1-C subfamily serine protease